MFTGCRTQYVPVHHAGDAHSICGRKRVCVKWFATLAGSLRWMVSEMGSFSVPLQVVHFSLHSFSSLGPSRSGVLHHSDTSRLKSG
jgi:hypothetical protein